MVIPFEEIAEVVSDYVDKEYRSSKSWGTYYEPIPIIKLTTKAGVTATGRSDIGCRLKVKKVNTLTKKVVEKKYYFIGMKVRQRFSNCQFSDSDTYKERVIVSKSITDDGLAVAH